MLIGYARVCTSDPDLKLQIDALSAAGCAHIATDRVSDATIARPGLADALRTARKGDTLVVWKLDRLGCTTAGLVDLAADLAVRAVALRSLTDGIDTGTQTGHLLFHVLGSIVEMERELMREQEMTGIATPRKAGGGGRKTVLTPCKRDIAVKRLAAGDRPQDVAEAIGIPVSTFYRHFPAIGRTAPADDK